MAKFLTTTGINYHLEELIKNSKEKLILISPYLKLSERIKELLEDKNRLKIDVRLVYGKSELQPEEIGWLKELAYVRTSFCKNLHAKCYLNEDEGIITSLNLYEFSQVNNNEMGVLISKLKDPDLFNDTYDECQRIIRISEEVRLSVEKVTDEQSANNPEVIEHSGKLTTSKLASKLGLKTAELQEKLISIGYLEFRDKLVYLTDIGKKAGGEFKKSQKFGYYFIWPLDLTI